MLRFIRKQNSLRSLQFGQVPREFLNLEAYPQCRCKLAAAKALKIQVFSSTANISSSWEMQGLASIPSGSNTLYNQEPLGSRWNHSHTAVAKARFDHAKRGPLFWTCLLVRRPFQQRIGDGSFGLTIASSCLPLTATRAARASVFDFLSRFPTCWKAHSCSSFQLILLF